MNLLPMSLRGYQRSWLAVDVVAGATLAAVAIPETMGYTSIAQTPVVTRLYREQRWVERTRRPPEYRGDS